MELKEIYSKMSDKERGWGEFDILQLTADFSALSCRNDIFYK